MPALTAHIRSCRTRPTRPVAVAGFTLIELMVAMLISFIVVGAAIALFEFTNRDVTSVDAQVQISQKARLALQNLMQELHSGCILPHYQPIRPGSTSTQLNFVSGVGEGPEPEKVYYRQVKFEGGEVGNLVEYRWPATIENGAVKISNENPTTNILASRVIRAAPGAPVFRYYHYYEPGEEGFSPGSLNPTPLPVPLTTEAAAKVAKVTIAFAVAPEESQTRIGGKIEPLVLEDSAVYRITPTAAVATPVPEPCE